MRSLLGWGYQMELKKRTLKGHLGISFLFFPLTTLSLLSGNHSKRQLRSWGVG
jgi:hypothetical protein